MTDAAAPRPPDGSLADLERFWARTAVGWHAVYLGLLGLVAALVVSDEDISTGRKVVVLALLGVMAGG
ncbi:MAG: hypothetical protein ACRD0W_21315, partial [Acidimicrobiales bacterium]